MGAQAEQSSVLGLVPITWAMEAHGTAAPSPSLGAEIPLFLVIDAEGCGVPHLISSAQHTPGM